MGNWEAALASAEIVLQKLPKDAKSVLIKAEALFNLCEFEHALLHFFRGQVNYYVLFYFSLLAILISNSFKTGTTTRFGRIPFRHSKM